MPNFDIVSHTLKNIAILNDLASATTGSTNTTTSKLVWNSGSSKIKSVSCLRGEAPQSQFKTALGETFNCNRCANDIAYWQPVEQGDFIYLQFQYPDFLNPNRTSPDTYGWRTLASGAIWYVGIELRDYETDTLITDKVEDISDDYYVGYDESLGQEFQVVKIDTSKAAFNNVDCFYFGLERRQSTFTTTSVAATEPYRFEKCRDLVTVSGKWTGRDLTDFIYDEPDAFLGTSSFAYKDLYKVRGEVLTDQYTITRERNDSDKVVSTERKIIDRFRTFRIPPYMAEKISNSLSAKEVELDGVEYDVDADINKNLESGSMWAIDVELSKDPNNKLFKTNTNTEDFTCN